MARPARVVKGTTMLPSSSATAASWKTTLQRPAPRIRRASPSMTPTMLSWVVAALMVSEAAATWRSRAAHDCSRASE